MSVCYLVQFPSDIFVTPLPFTSLTKESQGVNLTEKRSGTITVCVSPFIICSCVDSSWCIKSKTPNSGTLQERLKKHS